MPPLRLSDDQLDAIMRACQPLGPHARDLFLQEIADKLAVAGELGDGAVFRAIRETQKRHFDPPQLDRDISKYR
jgi:hypothetical protein